MCAQRLQQNVEVQKMASSYADECHQFPVVQQVSVHDWLCVPKLDIHCSTPCGSLRPKSKQRAEPLKHATSRCCEPASLCHASELLSAARCFLPE